MKRLIATVVVSLGLAGCGDTTTPTHAAMPPATTSSSQAADSAVIVSSHADNSATNKGEGKDALTPLSQGSSDADIQETTAVRKAIIADKAMSMNAQNIKIITANGKLTLRGTVDSIAERDRIDQLTRDAIGAKPYDDQLNVTHIK